MEDPRHKMLQRMTIIKQEDACARKTLSGVDVPEGIAAHMALFLRLVRTVLAEQDSTLREDFDALLDCAIHANSDDQMLDQNAFSLLEERIASFDIQRLTLLMRAFVSYFHLANICEENYRVTSLKAREQEVSLFAEADPINDITVAFQQLTAECGQARAEELLKQLEFHPVFTAHPTEARRKAVEGKIRRIAELLEKRSSEHGLALLDNERLMLQEIDSLIRTSPTAFKKPTPLEEADTITEIFDACLFDMVPEVYRRFDDWQLGLHAGSVPSVCPIFFKPGSWIGSDRDGNPNVTAKISRQVAEKFRVHVLQALAKATHITGRNLTLDAFSTPPSDELVNLWSHQVEMSEVITNHAEEVSASELHRACMLVMSERLLATINRTADVMYQNAEEYLKDLYCVQRSLVSAGAARAAFGALQTLIWQAETFGFYLVEMEFRQHSLVHERALSDIRLHGRWADTNTLNPITKEVLDTFRAIGQIQRKNGVDAARRYIISFTKSAKDIANVYELARLAFAHAEDVPVLDVIPLFEQVEDLEAAVSILDEMIKLPEVKARLAATHRRLEVMLGYSDSSKDAGPTSATLVLHATQQAISEWARVNHINLILMHGRGGAVGRGGGPANRAVLSQPKGSVNCHFKLTEQGEVIFARYGDPTLARRHVESVAGATLLQSAPSIEWLNTASNEKYRELSYKLDHFARTAYEDLLTSKNFAEWFSTVTPLSEIGLMPIGSRPAKRGLSTKSLEDLRTIPWIFSWSQARINLAAWYGLGSACEQLNDLDTLQEAYKEYPLFTTFIDNIEMSLAKTDERIAKRYLELGKRDDLTEKVLQEMRLTRRWVLAIVGDRWPLQNRRVLGPVIRMRLPFVNVLSITQAHILKKLREEHDNLTPEEREQLLYLMLCTVSGVAAGLQNTG